MFYRDQENFYQKSKNNNQTTLDQLLKACKELNDETTEIASQFKRPSNTNETSLEQMQKATRDLIKKTRYLLNDSKDLIEENKNDVKSDDICVKVGKNFTDDTKSSEISTNLSLNSDLIYNKSLLRFPGAHAGAGKEIPDRQIKRIYKILTKQIDNLLRLEWDPGGKYFSTDSTEFRLECQMMLLLQRHNNNEWTLFTVMSKNKSLNRFY